MGVSLPCGHRLRGILGPLPRRPYVNAGHLVLPIDGDRAAARQCRQIDSMPLAAEQQFDAVMQRAGGLWEPGSRRWLIERRRINPVLGHPG